MLVSLLTSGNCCLLGSFLLRVNVLLVLTQGDQCGNQEKFWSDDDTRCWCSLPLLVQLAASQLTFNLYPNIGRAVKDVVQRLLSAVFTVKQVTQQSEFLAVSRGVLVG